MTKTEIWTAETVISAIKQGNPNLRIVFGNYLYAFITRLEDLEISLQGINSIDQLNQKVLDGIEKLETLRKEFISVLEVFAISDDQILQEYLPVFFDKLFVFYYERGINLYTGTSADVLRNDHYRFFNQFLFISLTALLLENRCFASLRAIIQPTYKIYDKTYGLIQDVNFIRLRAYNYTLNQFTNSQKRISVTADYIRKYSSRIDFDRFVKADILLYYLSLWHRTNNVLDSTWLPELSVYNRATQILPFMVSKAYFERAKVLFGVSTIEEYKDLLDETNDTLDRSGSYYRVPSIKAGLLYDSVGSMD